MLNAFQYFQCLFLFLFDKDKTDITLTNKYVHDTNLSILLKCILHLGLLDHYLYVGLNNDYFWQNICSFEHNILLK